LSENSDSPAKSTNNCQQFMALYFTGQVLSICGIIFLCSLLRSWNYGVFRITRRCSAIPALSGCANWAEAKLTAEALRTRF